MDGKRHAKSLGEEIYTILKERIIRWEYLPYQRLTEQSLCEEFNVSRSPVREALKALEENGLIVKESNVGYEVVQPNLKDVFEYYEFRLALELFLVEKLAMDGIDDAVCEKLSRQWRSLHDDSHEINETIALLDENFHLELAKCVGNSYLTKQLLIVNERIHFIRMIDITTQERLKLTAKQHLLILNNIRNHDIEGAKAAIKENIKSGLENVEVNIRKALSHAYSKAGKF